jgi:ribonuclease J
MEEKHLHNSGHADEEALLRMVEILKPKNIIPIHTFAGDTYKNVFSGENIVRIGDGEAVEILS